MSTLRTREQTSVASREFPPSSKKLSCVPTRSPGFTSNEMSRSTQFASQGTRNVSDNITGVKADADAAAAAADDVKRASETLETQSQQLGSQVTQFLVRIRAA